MPACAQRTAAQLRLCLRRAAFEDFIGRGDRRIGAVIQRAWELGATNDAWCGLEALRAPLPRSTSARCPLLLPPPPSYPTESPAFVFRLPHGGPWRHAACFLLGQNLQSPALLTLVPPCIRSGGRTPMRATRRGARR